MSLRLLNFMRRPITMSFSMPSARQLVLASMAGITLGLASAGVMKWVEDNSYARDAEIWTAVQGYERSAAMEQVDHAALVATIETLATDEKWQKVDTDWTNMTIEQRADALQELSDMFMGHYAHLGIEPIELITYEVAPSKNEHGNTVTTGGSHRYGDWGTPDDSNIRWNVHPEALRIRGNNFENAAMVVIHEGSHSVQYQMADQLVYDGLHKAGTPFHHDAVQFQRGRVNYVSYDESWELYHTNPLEVHAFSNGDCVEAAIESYSWLDRMRDVNDPIGSFVSACFDEHVAGENLSVTHDDVRAAAEEQDDEPTPASPTYRGM